MKPLDASSCKGRLVSSQKGKQDICLFWLSRFQNLDNFPFHFSTVQESLAEKISNEMLRKELTCDICRKTFHGTFNFDRHIQIKHRNMYSEEFLAFHAANLLFEYDFMILATILEWRKEDKKSAKIYRQRSGKKRNNWIQSLLPGLNPVNVLTLRFLVDDELVPNSTSLLLFTINWIAKNES